MILITTADQNAIFKKLYLIFLKLLGYDTHKPNIIHSLNQLFEVTQHNIKVLSFYIMQFTHYIWGGCLFISVQRSNYSNSGSKCWVTVALLLMEIDQWYFMFRSWKSQDNKIHCHQLLWDRWQTDFIINGCNIYFSVTVAVVLNSTLWHFCMHSGPCNDNL